MYAFTGPRTRLFVYLIAVMVLFALPSFGQCPVTKPIKLAPDDKSGIALNPTLSWLGASPGYEVYIALGKTPPDPARDTPVYSGKLTSFKASGLKEASSYTWLVVGVDVKCAPSKVASDPVGFSTLTCGKPSNTSPTINAVDQPTSVTFEWSAISGASLYEVWAGVNGDAAKYLGKVSAPSTKFSTATPFPEGATVAWYVIAKTTNGCGDRQSSTTSFKTISCQFPPPDQTGPPNGSTQPVSVKFTWKGVSGVSDYGLFTSVNGGSYKEERVGNVTSVVRSYPSDAKVYWFVRGYPDNGCDPVDSSGEVFFVTEKDCPSGTPRLLSPADGEGDVSSPVTFKWDGVAGAESYELFAAEKGSTKFLSLGKTEGTSLVRSVAGVVTWYVDAIFPGECPKGQSVQWRFEVSDTSCPTQGPSLILPTDKATVESPVTFEWGAVAGALKYSLQLRKAGSPDPFKELLSTTKTKVEVKLDAAEFEWRVVAFPDRCDEVVSATRILAVKEGSNCSNTKPTELVFPPDGEQFTTDVVKFIWELVDGASGYDLQVSTDQGESWKTLGSTTEEGIVLSVPLGKIAWRVLTRFTGCNPIASLPRSIEVSSSKCSTVPPELIAPPLGATVPSPVLLQWGPVEGAEAYRVFASIDGDTPTAITGGISATSFEAALPAGTIVWFVEAISRTCGSSYSDKSKFVVSRGENCPTAGPKLTSPENGEENVPLLVTFEWEAVPGAVAYEVVVSINGEAPVSIGRTKETTLAQQMKGEKISWFVLAITPGCDPVPSERSTFGLAPDDGCSIAQPSRILPVDNSSEVSPVEFQWTSSGRGTYYRLWVTRDGEKEVVLAETLDTNVKRHLVPGAYSWFVEAFRKGCRLSARSDKGRFAVTESQSCSDAAPAPLSPADGVTLTDPEVMFNWSPVEGAIAYELWGSFGDGSETLIRVTRQTSASLVLREGKYRWFVRALFNGCRATRSQTLIFAVDLPEVCKGRSPFLLSPPIDEPVELSNPIFFSWTGATGGEGTVTYELWGSIDDSSPVKFGETTDTSFVADLPAGRVTWLVRAIRPGCPPVNSSRGVFVVVDEEECGSLRAPIVRAVLEAKSGKPYRVAWVPGPHAGAFLVEEATDPNFGKVESKVVVDPFAVFVHEVEVPTRFFYRVRAISDCDETQSLPSDVVSVAVVPASFSGTSNVDNVEALGTSGIVTIPIVVGGSSSKTGSATTFTAAMTQPWMTVTPSSGTIPPEGLTLNVTADVSALGPGANTGSLVLTTDDSLTGKTTSGGTSTTPVSVSLVAPVSTNSKSGPKPESLIIPAVGHAAGFNSQWQSDVRLTNIAAEATNYLLFFTPSGQSGTGSIKQASVTVSPGETVALNDVVKSWFGIGADGASATGTLEVRPQSNAITTTSNSSLANGASLVASTVASSRTYNLSSGGTFGQFIPATAFASFVGTGQPLSLQQVSQSDQFRTNIGVVEGSGEAATIQFTVFTNDGQQLDQWTDSLMGGEQRQFDQIIAQRGMTLDGGRVEVEVVSETGVVTAYASTVDNLTGDPTFITPVNKNAVQSKSKMVVSGVADLDNGIASWRTDIRLFNAGDTSENVTLSYYAQGSTTPSGSTQVTIEPGGVLEANDLLKTTFGITNSGGALHIESDGDANIVPTARTFNQTESGTYGQFIPAIAPEDGAKIGTGALQLLQVEQSASFRTNLGLAELSGNSATVEVTATVPGNLIAPIRQYPLGPNEFMQVTSILNDLGMTEAYNARISVRVIDGGGSVSAYASVVDNETQDPTYVPAQ